MMSVKKMTSPAAKAVKKLLDDEGVRWRVKQGKNSHYKFLFRSRSGQRQMVVVVSTGKDDGRSAANSVAEVRRRLRE